MPWSTAGRGPTPTRRRSRAPSSTRRNAARGRRSSSPATSRPGQIDFSHAHARSVDLNAFQFAAFVSQQMQPSWRGGFGGKRSDAAALPRGFSSPSRGSGAPGAARGLVRPRLSRVRRPLRRHDHRGHAGPRPRGAGVATHHARASPTPTRWRSGGASWARSGGRRGGRHEGHEVIWVEILAPPRRRRRAASLRRRGSRASAARYDNDVVIDDPYVAPHHLRVYRGEDGRLVAEDLGSANGLYTDDRAPRKRGSSSTATGRCASGARCCASATRATRSRPSASRRRRARMWPRALGLAVAVIALEMLSRWLGETAEPQDLALRAAPADARSS